MDIKIIIRINIKANVFTYCNNTKNAILIIDSFSNDDKDQQYFKNIIDKIKYTMIPIIILTNNINIILNKNIKTLSKLYINIILNDLDNRKINIINYYFFVIYLNIKLWDLKYNAHFKKYSSFKNYIDNINIESDELNNSNFDIIYNISQYFCYSYNFELDIIDLKLEELFSSIEYEIKDSRINLNNSSKDLILFITNKIFNIKKIETNNDLHNINKERKFKYYFR